MQFREFKESVIFLSMSIVIVLMLGTLIFSWVEGWHLIDALYFVTMTATTVGYGDFVPTHTLSKILTILYSLSIIPFVLYIFSLIARFQTHHMYSKVHELERKQKEQAEQIEKASGKITAQRRRIQEQEEDMEKQEKQLKEQARINKEQAEQIEDQEEELDVVEDIVEEALSEDEKKKKAASKKRRPPKKRK